MYQVSTLAQRPSVVLKTKLGELDISVEVRSKEDLKTLSQLTTEVQLYLHWEVLDEETLPWLQNFRGIVLTGPWSEICSRVVKFPEFLFLRGVSPTLVRKVIPLIQEPWVLKKLWETFYQDAKVRQTLVRHWKLPLTEEQIRELFHLESFRALILRQRELPLDLVLEVLFEERFLPWRSHLLTNAKVPPFVRTVLSWDPYVSTVEEAVPPLLYALDLGYSLCPIPERRWAVFLKSEDGLRRGEQLFNLLIRLAWRADHLELARHLWQLQASFTSEAAANFILQCEKLGLVAEGGWP